MSKIIGIDPDLEASGICELINGKVSTLYKLKIAEIIEDIPTLISNGFIFAIEDVEKKRATFRRGRTNNAVMMKIAQNVGQVKGIQRVICECINHQEGTLIKTPPGIGGRAKKNAEYFNSITGWSGISNEDTRDAAMVALYAYNQKFVD